MRKGKDSNDASFISGSVKQSQVNKGDSFDGSIDEKSMSDTSRSRSVGSKPRDTVDSMNFGGARHSVGGKLNRESMGPSHPYQQDRSPSKLSKSSEAGTPERNMNQGARFSFANKDEEANYIQRQSQAGNSLTIDMLQNIKKTKDYMAPTANSAYNVKKSREPKEYDLKSYKERNDSANYEQQEMMMRATVSPDELKEVQKHSTMQKIIQNKKDKKAKKPHKPL